MSLQVTLCLVAGLVVVGCSDDTSDGVRDAGLDHPGFSDAGDTTSIGPSGGVFSFHSGRVKLHVPAGALEKDLAVRVLQAKSYPQDSGLVPGTVYDLLPAGTVFQKPVKLTIAYLLANVPKGTPEAELRIHKVIAKNWQKLPGGVDRLQRTAWTNLDGFSKYGIKGPKPLAQPDAPKPPDAFDLGAQDLGAQDLGAQDKGAQDLGAQDLGAQDLGAQDLGAPDTGAPDTGAPDLGAPDTGAPDLGAQDLGAPDAPGTVCGNGKIEGKEACDGANLGGKTCTSAGYTAGNLACTKQCTLDTSKCTGCGNNKCEFGEDAILCPADCGSTKCGDSYALDPGEQCEGKLLGGHTCKSLGFSGGTLTCAEDCTLTSDECTSSGCSAADLSSGSYLVSASDSGTSSNPIKLSLVSNSPAMVVDAKGKTHLLFHKDLAYVTDQSGTWNKVALSPGDTVEHMALAVDAAGMVHVAHRDKKGTLYYRSNTSGKWVTETVKIGVGKHVSLVAGSATDVGIAYSVENASITDLAFSRRSGKTWKHASVAKDVSIMRNLVRDKAGKVYVAVGKSGNLQVFEEQAIGWVSLMKLTASSPSNLVVDAKGALHVLFSNSGLFHATNSKSSWNATKLSIPATSISVDTLAVDAAGNLYFVADGSSKGDSMSCLENFIGGTGVTGSCSTWPLVLYTNASGAWKASALSFNNYSASGQFWTGCTDYTGSASTSILGMAIHGAKLHLAYSGRDYYSSEVSGYGCTYMFYATLDTYNGHMVKCL